MLETGSNRIAKLSDKGESVEDHVEAVNLWKKIGIEPSVFMIYGFPTETKKERLKSAQLIKELELHYVKFNNMIP